ncbi:hypothetical protein SISNIDRAFT_453655 [Sistotremastrum niveocremeum HHB9708]|uniref:BAG domain-containing protein n=1 Tax=Sistotremastrum niveocremeum HHB9708 TaxID=1314777 RepID=A0A164V9C2_9AGAM|nr:hypothetical protein SISNIDRAFT_453655 [Sistotremastrum niveocremeum HHB9708]
MGLTIKWGKERFYLDLPPPETKLATVRQFIADQTHLPKDAFKMIHAGGVMKDDSAPISAYGLKPKSNITVIGSGELPPSRPGGVGAKSTERLTEQSTIATIRSELEGLRGTLVPALDKFLSNIQSDAKTLAADAEQEHARIAELLLQCLLRLDTLSPEGEWVDARKERKVAVKEVQSLLDRLDGAWKAARNSNSNVPSSAL